MQNLSPQDEVEVKEGFRDRIDGNPKRVFVKSVHPSEHVQEPWVVVVDENGGAITKTLYKRDRATGANMPVEPATMFPQHYFVKKESITSGQQ